MPYFVVTLKPDDGRKFTIVTGGENSTDAVLTAYKLWAGDDRYDEAYEEHGSGNSLAEELLADVFDCTEIYRAMVLEYVERRLDGGDTHIIL
jgi:hypothetical protein